jgi:small subunit ribosomal protein S16
MITIRLSRVGKKKQPMYRFVIMDKRKDPWGKSIEILGSCNPRTKETTLNVDRVKYWLSKGAETSESVWNILVDQKIVEGKKRNVTHLTAARRKAIAEEKAKTEPAQTTA